jgi:uncharacterized protein YbjT (DUF2867 family)
MKIVIVGGTGMIGSKLVEKLTQQGHEAVAAARSTGVDTVTGAGLEPVLEGAAAVVDVSSSGYFDAGDMQRFFEASGPNLLAAERQAGVGHHVTLSAVGTGRVGSGYFRAKRPQEDIVVASEIPFTIVRSTPFFEYICDIVEASGDGGVIRLPPVRVQPIAADDVAKALLRVVLGPPANGIIEIAGPDAYRLPVLAEEILATNNDPRTIVADDEAPYFGARMGGEPLTGEHPRFASTSFEEWLRRSRITAPRPRLAGQHEGRNA